MMLVITVVPISQTFPLALSGPEVSDNIHSSEYDYGIGKQPIYSFLHKTTTGYERLENIYTIQTYTGDGGHSGYEKSEQIVIEQYDSNFQLCAQPRVCSQAGGNPVYLRFSQPDNSESWDDAGNGI